jgi:hypothetical protein
MVILQKCLWYQRAIRQGRTKHDAMRDHCRNYGYPKCSVCNPPVGDFDPNRTDVS